MPVKRRVPKIRTQQASDGLLHVLSDGLYPEPADSDEVTAVKYFTSPEEIRREWERHRDAILQDWSRERPGRRPALWWELEGRESRRRLGGAGVPAFETLAYAPAFDYGIPRSWIDESLVEYFGVAVCGPPIDPGDPPVFESQAEYLRRHGALLPGETDRLKLADFEAETVHL
jgi:hypothetical protein